jgi:hypothetical protein
LLASRWPGLSVLFASSHPRHELQAAGQRMVDEIRERVPRARVWLASMSVDDDDGDDDVQNDEAAMRSNNSQGNRKQSVKMAKLSDRIEFIVPFPGMHM